MSIPHKPTPEELITHVQGSARGNYGEYQWEILCKYCRDTGRIGGNWSQGRESIAGSDKRRLKAARKFVGQGWRIEDAIPVCPTCYRWKFPMERREPESGDT